MYQQACLDINNEEINTELNNDTIIISRDYHLIPFLQFIRFHSLILLFIFTPPSSAIIIFIQLMPT